MKKHLHIIIPVILAIVILVLIGWYAYSLDLPKISKTEIEVTVVEKTVETYIDGNTTHYIYELKLEEIDKNYINVATGEYVRRIYSLTVHETDNNSLAATVKEGDTVIALVKAEQYRTQGKRVSRIEKLVR